jgi:hypothetical protein
VACSAASRPDPLPGDLRELLTAHKAEPVALLAEPAPTPTDPWDRRTALRLMEAADELVEYPGVDGRRPEVVAAVAKATLAYAARDLQAVRRAVVEFTAVVGALAAPGQTHPQCAPVASDAADGKAHPDESCGEARGPGGAGSCN